MNVREAILKAADHIEREPESFDYQSNCKPGCGTPGCFWGWIGFYGGVQRVKGESYLHRVNAFVGHNWTVMTDIANSRGQFIGDPKAAPGLLREFADKYHPAHDGNETVSWSSCAWRPSQVRA